MQLDRLAGAVEISLQAAAMRRDMGRDYELWLGISKALWMLLTTQQPTRAASEYHRALTDVTRFAVQAARSDVSVLEDLGIRVENANTALQVVDEIDEKLVRQKRVLLFVGHRIDPPDQARRRFPAEMELLVKQKIEEAVLSEKELAKGQVLGIAGGFSGGDILFHEVCAAHAIPTLLCLTRSKEEYVGTWVTNIGCEWVERFNRLLEQLQGKCPPAVRVHLFEKLPDWLVMRLLNNSDSFIFAKGCLPGSLDLSQDLLSFSPPDVALGFEVMPGEVLHDGID